MSKTVTGDKSIRNKDAQIPIGVPINVRCIFCYAARSGKIPYPPIFSILACRKKVSENTRGFQTSKDFKVFITDFTATYTQLEKFEIGRYHLSVNIIPVSLL